MLVTSRRMCALWLGMCLWNMSMSVGVGGYRYLALTVFVFVM